MSEVQINEDISVPQYFEQTLPQLFDEQIAANPPTDLEGEEYRVNYDIDGALYGVRIKDGTKLEVINGGLEEPHLSSTLTEADWRDAVLGRINIVNPVLAYNTKKHLDKIKNFKGAFKLRLSREGGETFNSATIFNSIDTPSVTIVAKAADYALVQSGKLNPQMAMMTGKIKFEGSLPFLMALGALTTA